MRRLRFHRAIRMVGLTGMLALTVFASSVNGQQVVERLEGGDEFPQLGVRLVEGAIIGHASGGGFSMSVQESNGVRVTTVNENGRTTVIEQSPESIKVTYAKTYGPDELEQLKADHPDLHMHVASFPTTSDDSKVYLSVTVEKTVEAESAEALERDYPDAFEVYEKYNQAQAVPVFRGGLEGLRLRLDPRLGEEAVPLRIDRRLFDRDRSDDGDEDQNDDDQNDDDSDQVEQQRANEEGEAA